MAADQHNTDNQSKEQISSSTNWQIVVLPSLLAFLLLASYGFYLIYNLVGDVHRIADSVGINMSILAGQMQQVTLNLDELTGSVHSISVNLDDLTITVKTMNDIMEVISTDVGTLQPMLTNLVEMKGSMDRLDINLANMNQNILAMDGKMGQMTNLMGSMSTATYHMTQGVSGLNQSIGRPMSFMNSFAPW